MAYLAFAEAGVGGLGEAVAPRVGKAASPRADAPVAATVTGLSALEWAVVALARNDRKGSLRTPGRMAMALGTLFGERPNPRLADPRLEALRRIAVLSWHHGYTVPSHEVRAFLAAGFTPAQYELMVDSIGVDRREGQQERLRA